MARLRGIDAADRRGKVGKGVPDSSSEWPCSGRITISQDGVITRRRLLQFGRSASEPITLVSAPAGYGKTTLLQQWAPDTGGPVVRLDPVGH